MLNIQILIDSMNKELTEPKNREFRNNEKIVLRYAARTFYMPKRVIENSMYEDSTDSFVFLDDTDDILASKVAE